MWKNTLILSCLFFGVLESSILLGSDFVGESDWKLSIAVPKSNGKHTIQLSPTEHFHVVLENKIKIPQKIWKKSNSWGYSMLYFAITDESGNRLLVRKQSRNWRKNAASYWSIDSGEQLVFDVSFASKDWKYKIASKPGEMRHLKIQAIIDVPKNTQTKRHGVWHGLIKSKIYEMDLYH